ncbi:MCP four helix bundle domain-containing protein [Pantoea dispersa]|uniref:methyl-accepting chemotaxis protein n=1 Tax=Pantoea dispersa TaxID=59814 RepID=UPI001CA65A75|nr:methyl-accepting chemotaxis protein [Pantoea dispersa]QZY91800.1 MCP four helix bundle domain-containing protein [Pantoea dispersa]
MRLTLRARLAAIVSLLCLLLIIAAVWGIIGLRAADQRAQNAYQNELLPLQYSSRLYRMVQEQSATLFDALRYWTDSSEVEKRLARIAQYGQQINADRHTWQQLAFDAQTKPLSQRFLTHLDGWQGALHEAGELLKGGNPSAALVVIETRLRSGSQLLQQDIDQLDALMRQHAQTAWQQGNHDYLLARNSLIAILLLGLSLALVSGWLLIRSINRSIAQARELADAIAGGELNHRIGTVTRDEMGELMQALLRMDVRLAEIVREVGESAHALSDAARQMADGNDDLSERTHAQASSLEQTAASMEQMTATVKHNADNAAQANELASDVRHQAERGSGVLRDAVSAMEEIESSSKRIADINRVIDEIAFQTNLLALNAAVEAARAGEQGRGFAVVASEVRQLAQRSAGAAQEIKALIDASVGKVEAGSALVQRSGEMLNDINHGVARMVDIVGEIAVASRQQSSGIEQVNTAVIQMDGATQQNASLVQQASAASQTVSQHAGLLVEKMAFFRLQQP